MTTALSAQEKEFKESEYIILSMVMAGHPLDRFADDAKIVAEKFIPLKDDERAAKLEELKEFAPRPRTQRQIEDSFYNMFPSLKEWCGWKP